MFGPFEFSVAIVQTDTTARNVFASKLHALHGGAVLEGPSPGDDPSGVARRLQSANGTPFCIIALEAADPFGWRVVQALIWNGWLDLRPLLILDAPLEQFTSLTQQQLEQLGFQIKELSQFNPEDTLHPLRLNHPPKPLVVEARRVITREARQKFESDADLLRHRFEGHRAAVRLLCGALAHRQIDPREFDDAIAEIALGARVEGAFTSIRENLAAHLNYSSIETLGRLRNLDASRGVLAIVQNPDHGWREFFSAVFEAHRVVVVNPARSEEYLAESDDIAIVFHDLSNGDSPEDRVRIVERIMREHFDLPLIVFSPRENLREMRRYLRAGAAGYFGYDTGEDLISNFQQFEGIVREAIPERWVRQLWQELRGFSGPLEHSTGRKLYRRVVNHLRIAYFHLTADLTDPRARLLANLDQRQGLNPEGLARHAAISCGTALEIVVKHLYQRRLGADYDASRDASEDRVPNLLQILAGEGCVSGEQLVRGTSIWRLRNLAAHDSRGGTIDPARARKAFSDTISLLQGLLDIPDVAETEADYEV